MMRRVYTLFLGLIAPVMWLLLWRRARREGGQWDILSPARFGRYDGPVPATGPLWIHAVSLGETRAAKSLIDSLLAVGTPVLLTHTTATARTESSLVFATAIARGQLRQAWLPYDFPGAQKRFLLHFRPRAGLLIEREVWPNLVAQTNALQIPLALVSARLSERSAASMMRLRPVMGPAFRGLNLVLAQTSDDARRLAHLGARNPQVIGNLKFDVTPAPALLRQGSAWRDGWARPVVAFASTRDGEEAAFVRAVVGLPALVDDPLFVLIPRHPQRFEEIAGLLKASGVAWQRRSRLHDVAAELRPGTRWLLGDTVGEMPAYFSASDVAIVGGSFENFGGQNLVEASACGVPVIVGPHTQNFAQAAQDAIAAGAALRAPDAAAATDMALQLLASPGRRRSMVAAAHGFVAAHQGATGKAMSALRPWL